MPKLKSKIQGSDKIKKISYYAILIIFCGYIFSIPSFGSRTPANYIMYGLFALLAFTAIFYSVFYKKIKISIYSLVILAFVMFAFIGTAIYSHSFRSWFSLVLLLGSFFVFYFVFKIVGDKHLVVLLAIIGLFVFSIYFILYYRKELLNFSNYLSDGFRLGSYFDNQNGVSAYSVIGVALSLYFILFSKNKFKYIILIPLLSIFIVGISTGSRTFIVAIIAISILMLYFKFNKTKLLYLLVLIILVVVFIVLLNTPLLSTLKFRLIRAIETFFGNSSRIDTSSVSRVTWLDYGFYLGNKHLLTGLGVDGFMTFSGINSYTHSNYSEVWCDFGIIGFVLFYLPLIMVFVRCIRTKNKNISFVAPFVLYYLLVSFSNVFYYNKLYYFVLSFMFYLSYEEDAIYRCKVPDVSKQVKKIVFTCDGMESGGAEKVISVLSNTLAMQGYEIFIIGVSSRRVDSFYKLADSIKYISIHKENDKRIGFFKRVKVLHKQLKSIKPDVVISFLPHVIVYTHFAMFGIKAPLIVSERNDPSKDPKGFLLRTLKKLSFNQSAGCVFQTSEAKNYFSKRIQSKSTIIHNPVILNYDGAFSQSRKNTIVSVGRLVPQKNFQCLIDAFSLFKERHPNYLLKIYGDGPEKEYLENYIKCKGLMGSVLLMGNSNTWHQDEVDSAMFVCSSDFEGMPNALAEAIALGVPVVSTNCPVGGPRELISYGVNGYLTNINDSNDIADKMEKALSIRIDFKEVEAFRKTLDPQETTSQWLEFIRITLERELSE